LAYTELSSTVQAAIYYAGHFSAIELLLCSVSLS